MVKRLRWFISGTGVGIGASIWAHKKIKAKLEQLTPLAVTRSAVDSALRIKDRFTTAMGDARVEAAVTEAALRKEMGLDPKRRSQAK
ncbi:MAG: hypothetical protein EPN30_07185 [Actinomycetota bacterium]|nr:MAG: hypothetical protein EPN30_07185 [Actinomycetota bacterium]